MLSKKYRISKKQDFLKLKKHGQTKFSPLFNFSFLRDNQNEPLSAWPRFGFITSTNLDKRATVRNRVKRRVREVVRLFLKNNPTPARFSGLLGVFIIRKAAVLKNYEEIESEVNRVLSEVSKL